MRNHVKFSLFRLRRDDKVTRLVLVFSLNILQQLLEEQFSIGCALLEEFVANIKNCK